MKKFILVLLSLFFTLPLFSKEISLRKTELNYGFEINNLDDKRKAICKGGLLLETPEDVYIVFLKKTDIFTIDIFIREFIKSNSSLPIVTRMIGNNFFEIQQNPQNKQFGTLEDVAKIIIISTKYQIKDCTAIFDGKNIKLKISEKNKLSKSYAEELITEYNAKKNIKPEEHNNPKQIIETKDSETEKHGEQTTTQDEKPEPYTKYLTETNNLLIKNKNAKTESKLQALTNVIVDNETGEEITPFIVIYNDQYAAIYNPEDLAKTLSENQVNIVMCIDRQGQLFSLYDESSLNYWTHMHVFLLEGAITESQVFIDNNELHVKITEYKPKETEFSKFFFQNKKLILHEQQLNEYKITKKNFGSKEGYDAFQWDTDLTYVLEIHPELKQTKNSNSTFSTYTREEKGNEYTYYFFNNKLFKGETIYYLDDDTQLTAVILALRSKYDEPTFASDMTIEHKWFRGNYLFDISPFSYDEASGDAYWNISPTFKVSLNTVVYKTQDIDNLLYLKMFICKSNLKVTCTYQNTETNTVVEKYLKDEENLKLQERIKAEQERLGL